MACPHVDSINFNPPTPAQSVYREDCTQCFDSIDDAEGLNVCLQCFNGGCAGDRRHSTLHNALREHPLSLNIKRSRKQVVREEPPQKITKIAIAAETEEDRYVNTLSVKCLECDTTIDAAHPKLAAVVEGIMKANTFSRKEEVKAWEQEMSTCEHILTMQQGDARKIPDQDPCAMCDLKENLWLCLECGALGCGRQQFGGVGGNGHALEHKKQTGHGVAVKLGSISADGAADVYCYNCDDERVDDAISTHLANWGINIAERQKTEKSLTEMQIEQNLKWEFSMTTEDGKELKPLFGPSLTGLKNLGNSCYLASILQCLFDMPAFQKRYNQVTDDLPNCPDPAADLETQLRKLGDGLLSGRYSKPDSDVTVPTDAPQVPHQKGLAPAMFKHLIGRGHSEFSTMRQQDAFELFQHLVKLITRSKHPTPTSDPTIPFRFVLEQRLQCRSCNKVRYSTTEQDNIMIILPMEKLPPKEGEEDAVPAWKPVTFKECLDNFTSMEIVELTCSSCGSKDGYTKQSLFKTFPDVFVVNARRMAVVNWVEIKVDVPVIVDDGPFLMDAYLSKGQQPGEEALPEDATSAAPAFVPNDAALAQLESMGFPNTRATKALHATGNADSQAAMEWLFAHMEDADIDVPFDLGTAGSSGGAAGSVDREKIESLGAMGFGAPQAKKALTETGGDMERAVEWLFNHPDDQGLFEDDDGAGPVDESPKEDVPAGSAVLPAKFQLQSIVCHKGTSIHAGHYVAFIRKQLSKETDDMSWVLFNDEKVVEATNVAEMRKFAYVYFFERVPRR